MATLLYDADCGFCTRSARLAARLPLRTEVRPLQSTDLVEAHVSPERAQAEIPFVAADGAVAYGHAAVAGALRTGPLPFRLIGRALVSRPVDPVAKATYRWIAGHRHQLPGGTAACAVAASRPSRRASATLSGWRSDARS